MQVPGSCDTPTVVCLDECRSGVHLLQLFAHQMSSERRLQRNDGVTRFQERLTLAPHRVQREVTSL